RPCDWLDTNDGDVGAAPGADRDRRLPLAHSCRRFRTVGMASSLPLIHRSFGVFHLYPCLSSRDTHLSEDEGRRTLFKNSHPGELLQDPKQQIYLFIPIWCDGRPRSSLVYWTILYIILSNHYIASRLSSDLHPRRLRTCGGNAVLCIFRV